MNERMETKSEGNALKIHPQYLHSPADGGVVLQLPVTMSPKLEEFPPAFLLKQQRIIRPIGGFPREVWSCQLTSASAPA